MIDEFEAEPPGDLLLQRFQFLILELDHLARLEVDQVVMVFEIDLEAGVILVEVMPLHEVQLVQEMQRAVDGGDADRRVDLTRTMINGLHRWVVDGFGQNLQDDTTLIGHLQAGGDAPLLERHGSSPF